MMRKAMEQARDDSYFAVSPLMIFPRTLGRFKVFIRQAGRYVLYAPESAQFTVAHRQKLHEAGVTEVYIRSDQRLDYEHYVENHLPQILSDPAIPIEERSQVFHTASSAIVKDIFDRKLPAGLTRREFNRINKFVEQSVRFLSSESSLQRVFSMVSHDYSVYTHSVHVFVYATALMQCLRLDEDTIVQAGIGCMLHDVGKMAIPKEILNKPGPLTPEERLVINTHPVRGVALCLQMPLTPLAASCILLHHERVNGTGYPGCLGEEQIPSYIRAITAADVYDALTTKRPYADAMSPFEALRIMREEMSGFFDMDVYKCLVMILSGAKLV